MASMASSYPFRSALVTGASSGIGASMAQMLLADGVETILVARRGDRLAEILDGRPGEILEADLTTPAGVGAVAERISDTSRSIDLVVNNAGFGTSGWFWDLDPDRLAREIELNVTALTRLSHAAIAAMVPRGRGHLLNVSSVASFQPGPKLAVYSATKAYVTSLTQALHEEVRGTGVKVTALCPGLTRTEFQSVSNTEGYETQFPKVAWTDVDDVARQGLADAARGRAVSVPGALYKMLTSMSQVTPGVVSRRISGLAMKTRR
jgi:short-subunit dehydrogenase